MSNPTTKKLIEEASDEALDDETMPMPALSNLLEATQPDRDGEESGTDSVQQQLKRLIELAEATNYRLDRITDLLAQSDARGRSSATKNAEE